MVKYGYQMQHLGDARRALMLPHYEGKGEALAECLRHCEIAFDDPGINELVNDECEEALSWKADLERYIQAWQKAHWSRDYLLKLSDDEISEIASALDELANHVFFHFAQSCMN